MSLLTNYIFSKNTTEITYNFWMESSDWSDDTFNDISVIDEASFIDFLEEYGVTGVSVENFSIVNDGAIKCNLTKTGGYLFLPQNQHINKLVNTDCFNGDVGFYIVGNELTEYGDVPNVDYLDLTDNPITVLPSIYGCLGIGMRDYAFDSIVENVDLDICNFLSLIYSSLTTAQFDNLVYWAENIAVNDGYFECYGNVDLFSDSVAYSYLIDKGWTIRLTDD